jgi:DNA adenine methylase
MTYDGGKAGAGVYQALINLMPVHDLYIEPFLGAGAVMRRKRPAAATIAIERDAAALQMWRGDEVPNLTLIEGDAISWLRKLGPTSLKTARGARDISSLKKAMLPGRTLVYCDPPYVMSSRSCSHRRLYRCELSDADHVDLLAVLRSLPCMVMISGYWTELYARTLADWRVASFWTTNRAHARVQEFVWMNFPEPHELHDYRFLGCGFRERERIKRKQKRWRAKLGKMPALERHALMAALRELHRASPEMASAADA